MGLRINTNVASIAAQNSMGKTQRQVESAIKQLATGTRFADISQGAGDYAISEHLRGQIAGMKAARDNTDFARSFVAVAEGGLNEQNNILIRLRELSIQAASDTFADEEREFLNMEAQQLKEEFDRIAQTTSFGSQQLLAGDGTEYQFQVGAYQGEENQVSYIADTDTSAEAMGIADVDVSDQDYALDSLEAIDEAIFNIGAARANFGAIQSRFTSISNNAGVQIENLTAAHGRISDTDVAEQVGRLTQGMILQQVQSSVLAQANQYPNSVLKLING